MTLDAQAWDLLFGSARSYSAWQAKDVPQSLLEEAWNLARMGPTAVNGQPLRIVFVKSPEAKQRLLRTLAPGNEDKTMTAPATAVCGYDLDFLDNLPRLLPKVNARKWFDGKPDLIRSTALENACYQAAYFVVALRGLGLDVGPIGGFDMAKADEAFFAGRNIRSFLLLNIGYGDEGKLYPRSPRLEFPEACKLV